MISKDDMLTAVHKDHLDTILSKLAMQPNFLPISYQY